MPHPDHYDCSKVLENCERYKDFAIVAGGAGLGDILNSTGMVWGVERTLMDLCTDEEGVINYLDRRTEILYEVHRRIFEAAKGRIDILWMGEDLGTQIAPIISLDLFRKHIRPRHQPFIDLGKKYGARVIIHTCGSSSWAYPDYIEMGMDGVDTLQPEATNMSPEYLKKHFGKQLTLHGCISTAGPVATGTVQETVDYCRRTLDIMMPGSGYCFSPTHCLQDNSPLENVVAMYDTAKEFGRY